MIFVIYTASKGQERGWLAAEVLSTLRSGFEETVLMGGGGASLGRHLLKRAWSPNMSAPLFKGGLAEVEYNTQATGF